MFDFPVIICVRQRERAALSSVIDSFSPSRETRQSTPINMAYDK